MQATSGARWGSEWCSPACCSWWQSLLQCFGHVAASSQGGRGCHIQQRVALVNTQQRRAPFSQWPLPWDICALFWCCEDGKNLLVRVLTITCLNVKIKFACVWVFECSSLANPTTTLSLMEMYHSKYMAILKTWLQRIRSISTYTCTCISMPLLTTVYTYIIHCNMSTTFRFQHPISACNYSPSPFSKQLYSHHTYIHVVCIYTHRLYCHVHQVQPNLYIQKKPHLLSLTQFSVGLLTLELNFLPMKLIRRWWHRDEGLAGWQLRSTPCKRKRQTQMNNRWW